MPGAERAPRPTQEQRDEAVDLLDRAFADGQLDSEEHLARLTRVLEATEAKQVAWALLDLQTPPPVPPPAPTFRQQLRATWQSTSRGERTGSAVAVAVLVGLLGVAVFYPNDEASDRDSYSQIAEVPTSAERISEFTRAYEDEFGTTMTGGVQLSEDSVQAKVPIDGEARRYETSYLQNGSFNEYGTVSSGEPQVDLANIDHAAAQDNLEVAWNDLGVEDPTEITILISGSSSPLDGGEPQITYVVTNEFDETGRLRTDFSGTELSRDPFEPPNSQG